MKKVIFVLLTSMQIIEYRDDKYKNDIKITMLLMLLTIYLYT